MYYTKTRPTRTKQKNCTFHPLFCLNHLQNPTPFSQIHTTNAVGYNSVGLLENGATKAVGQMFFKVGGGDLTLGDLHITGIEGTEGMEATVSLMFLNGNGGKKQGTVTVNWFEFGTKGEGTEGEDWCYGWYDSETGESWNNYPLPAGEGVWVGSANTKYSIQCNGEVPQAPISVQLLENGASKFVVNSMPADITLGDLYITGVEGEEGFGGTVSLMFLNGNGGKKQGTVSLDWYEFGTKGEGTEGEDWCYGWYDSETGDSWNNYPLPAGEGVWMSSANTKYFANIDSILVK